MPYFCYIIHSEKTNKFYVGHTANLEIRLEQHNAGRNISTKSGTLWSLKYTEEFSTKTEAAKRETQIKKKKSRKYIEQLISSAG